MSRSPSSPTDRPRWLRFEAGNEDSNRLFEHAADWRKRTQYPEIKPLVDYTREDYLRLAWELLRRMPRYRHQFHRLQKFGITSPSFFRTSRHHFYSSENRPGFPGWRDYPLFGHFCDPPIEEGETFGSYVARLGWIDVNQENEGQPWFVMNRYKWVMDFWGMEYLPDPQAEYPAQNGQALRLHLLTSGAWMSDTTYPSRYWSSWFDRSYRLSPLDSFLTTRLILPPASFCSNSTRASGGFLLEI